MLKCGIEAVALSLPGDFKALIKVTCTLQGRMLMSQFESRWFGSQLEGNKSNNWPDSGDARSNKTKLWHAQANRPKELLE